MISSSSMKTFVIYLHASPIKMIDVGFCPCDIFLDNLLHEKAAKKLRPKTTLESFLARCIQEVELICMTRPTHSMKKKANNMVLQDHLCSSVCDGAARPSGRKDPSNRKRIDRESEE